MIKRIHKYFLSVATFAILATVASGAPYLGDFVEDETVHFIWATNGADGAAITRATNGTVLVFKDNATSGTTKGITDTEDFNSVTGIHACTVDTSADAFYATGANYTVILNAATIDSLTVNTALAHFSILNRYTRGTDSAYTGTPPTATTIAAAVMEDAATSAALATAQADLDNPAQYKATGFSTHSAADVWSAASRELSTPANYKADVSGLATAAALATAQADLDDPGQYKATGFSTHAAADVWAVVTRTLSTSPPTLAQIWEYTTRTLTSAGAGGATAQEVWEYGTRALSTPNDYKADVSALATAAALATAQADLDNPSQYKATGFSTHSAADVWAAASRELSTPANYKADVSGLATSAALATAQADLDNAAQYKATGFSTHSAADVWTATTRTLTSAGASGATAEEVWTYGTRALSTPNDYKATGFSTHSPADVWTYTTRTLSASAGGDASAANQTSILSALADIEGTGFTSATHSLVAIRERGDSAWVTGGTGSGSIVTTYTLTSSATGLPIADAVIEVSTDSAKANLVGAARTNTFGEAVFLLDAGTYYFWRKKSGFSFDNPDTVEVAP